MLEAREEHGCHDQICDWLLGRRHRVLGVAAFSVKRTRAQQPLPHRLFYFVLTATAAILLNGSARVMNWNRAVLPHTVLTGILGDFLVFVGLFFAIWARIALGQLECEGDLEGEPRIDSARPYRVVRHPIYSGLLLMIFGTAILVGQLGSFVVLAFCSCGLWLKLRREETLLTNSFRGIPNT